MDLYLKVSLASSKLLTRAYSTSFSLGIRTLDTKVHDAIYAVYGFVRLADEIVDTFHEHDKFTLLAEFKKETYASIERGISLNPILNSFQQIVNEFEIEHELIEAFFNSMESDLTNQRYDSIGYSNYIYGSAEVVGLMCLYVFCDGNQLEYEKLKPAAQSLGAAFQKVNFLRDVKADYQQLNRVYFPGVDFNSFTHEMKESIVADIENDFHLAYQGILKLPLTARFGVYLAYKYYLSLLKKIKAVKPQRIMEERIRIPNYQKAWVAAKVVIRTQLNML